MALSRHTSCSHAVKNTSWNKKETDHTPANKTEQVTTGMKQFQLSNLVILLEIQTMYAVLQLFNVS